VEGSLPPGATPIDPDEADGLIPEHISTRGELDELEEANIQEGLKWADAATGFAILALTQANPSNE